MWYYTVSFHTKQEDNDIQEKGDVISRNSEWTSVFIKLGAFFHHTMQFVFFSKNVKIPIQNHMKIAVEKFSAHPRWQWVIVMKHTWLFHKFTWQLNKPDTLFLQFLYPLTLFQKSLKYWVWEVGWAYNFSFF